MEPLKNYPIPPRPPVEFPGNTTLYISGPMSEREDYNYPRFFYMEATLHEMGYDTINPARLDDEMGWPEDGEWSSFLHRDLNVITSGRIDAVVLFDDWSNSRGAVLEAYVARQLGYPVYEFVEGELVPVERISAALEAQEIVLGARRYTYGHPLDNFQTIANLWNATISHKLEEPLTISDVALLMIQLKVGREINKPNEDNRTDIIGYSLALDEALIEAERRHE